METELTLKIKDTLFINFNKMGVFCCPEVTIGGYRNERVDFMTYDTKSIFRCYEIKITLSDFNSKCSHTFVGHYNYYVLTADLYKKVKDKISDNIGIYIYDEQYQLINLVKKAKKQDLSVDINILYNSFIRSLSREASIVLKGNHNKLKSEILKNDYNYNLKKHEKEVEELKLKYNQFLYYICDKFGAEWKQDFIDNEKKIKKKDIKEKEFALLKEMNELRRRYRNNEINKEEYEKSMINNINLFL